MLQGMASGLRVIDTSDSSNRMATRQSRSHGMWNAHESVSTPQTGPSASRRPPRRQSEQRLRVLEKRRDVAEFREIDGITCPVCNEQNLRAVDALRAHIEIVHPALKFKVWEVPESGNGVVGEVFIDHYARRKKPSRSQLDIDVLYPGQDRYLLSGKPWIKRTPNGHAPVETGLEPPSKRRRIASKQTETSLSSISSLPKSPKLADASPQPIGLSLRQSVRSKGPKTETPSPPIDLDAQSSITHDKNKQVEHSKAILCHQYQNSEAPRNAQKSHPALSESSTCCMLESKHLGLNEFVEEAQKQAKANPRLRERARRLRNQFSLIQELNTWIEKREEKLRHQFSARHEAHPSSMDDDLDDLIQLRDIQERFWPATIVEKQGSKLSPVARFPSSAASRKSEAIHTAAHVEDKKSLASIVKYNAKKANDDSSDSDDNTNYQLQDEDKYFTRSMKRNDNISSQTNPTNSEPWSSTRSIPRKSSTSFLRGSKFDSADKNMSPSDRAALSRRMTWNGSREQRKRKFEEPSRSSSIENVDPQAPLTNEGMSLRSNRRLSDPHASKLLALALENRLASKRRRKTPEDDDTELQSSTPKQDIEHKSPRTLHSPLDKITSPRPSLRPLPVRQKKKYIVPAAPEGVTFFTSVTKRPLQQGEVLSESDDDCDNAWLDLKQTQLIDQLADVPPEAKEFMKAWNQHFHNEAVPGDRYFADAFLRFVKANAALLRRHDMQREFQRKQAELKAEGLIRQAHVSLSNELIAATGLPLSYRKPRKSSEGPEWATRCVCGKDVLDYRGAVTCSGEDCENPDYHLKCVGLRRRSEDWLCPSCKE